MGMAELFVIAIVGLLVIGPEKLPETIKTVLVWAGKTKRMLNATRMELEQQLGVDDIRREIHNEEVLASIEALKKQGKLTADETNEQIEHITRTIKEDFEPEDEGLYGEQRANHPPEQSEEQVSHTRTDPSHNSKPNSNPS